MKKLAIIPVIIYVSIIYAITDSEDKIFILEENTFHSNDLYETLNELEKTPLDINSATENDLKKLPWLSEKDIKKIVSFRNKKPFTNISELKKIGLNEITILEISDYITIYKRKEFPLLFQVRSSFSQKNRDSISPLKTYAKLRYSSQNWDVGGLIQKDPKEVNWVDFYSYYLQYSSQNVIRKVILGKYKLAFGEGILFAPKLGMSKSSAATTTPIKTNSFIKPYLSSFEIWDLNGIASEIQVSKLLVTNFYSNNYLDANLNENLITSFNETGFHEDNNTKNNVRNEILGSSLIYKEKNLETGFLFFNNNFSKKFEKNFSKKYYAGSYYWQFQYHLVKSFGEFAISDGKNGVVSGIKLIGDNLDQLFLFRKYQKGFPTWHGNPFSASTNFENEVGYYYGITYKPTRNMKLTAYFDVWQYPKTNYFEKMPTSGCEQFIQSEIKNDVLKYRLTYQRKDREKYINYSNNAIIRNIERNTIRNDFWIEQNRQFRHHIRMELSFEYMKDEENYKKGILLAHQFIYKNSDWELYFTTVLFHSKILLYLYEYNVDGVMQNSIMTGDDIYLYVLAKKEIIDKLELQIKLAGRLFENNTETVYFQIIKGY